MPLGLGLLACAGSAGCAVVDAKVANLRALHEEDGRVRRVAVVQSDFGFTFRQLLRTLSFRGGGLAEPAPEAVDDPNGTSLENLIALGRASGDDERTLGLQAELFSWLAVDCEYVLSRERAVIELGDVGARLGLSEPVRPPDEQKATRPAEAVGWLRDLRAAVDPLLARGAQGGSAEAVAQAVGAIDVTVLDRDGARRLLEATNVWRDVSGFSRPELRPLRELRLELARRSVELALAQSLFDPAGRVRAAAIEACVALGGNRSPRLLRAGLTDGDPEVVAAALRVLERHGVPGEPEPEFADDAEGYRDAWIALVVRLLRVVPDGTVSVAACRALERITDAGLRDLRPEVWIAWWDAREERAEGAP